MFTNMNIGQTQTMTGHVLWLSSGNPPSQISSSHGGRASCLWFVCVLVMIAARGDYCSQTTRSMNKAKVPLSFKLKKLQHSFQMKVLLTPGYLLWERVQRAVK